MLPAAAFQAPRRTASVTRLLLVGLAVVGLVVVGSWARGLLPVLTNPFGSDTVDRSMPAVLQALEDVQELRGAVGTYQVMIDVEDDARLLPDFLQGDRVQYLATGSVDAVVDLAGLGPDRVTLADDGDAVVVTLPHAHVSTTRVDPANSRVIDRDRGLLDRLGSVLAENPSGEGELLRLAERRLTSAAEASGLVERAEANTAATVRALLDPLGFDRVDVRFAGR